jgi:hypothetical protein
MKYAYYNNKKTHAKEVNSGSIGTDLWFKDYKVIACVGKYRQYWKYIGDKPDLPNGYEPETEWHAAWKSSLLDESCEVICGANREHRADIKTQDFVIEIQKCRIDGWAVIERNRFYKELTGNRLVWIVNVEDAWKNKRISTKLDNSAKDGRFIIKWNRAWKWVEEMAITTDTYLFLDFNPQNDKMIYTWIHDKKMFGAWYPKVKFFNKYLKGIAKPEFDDIRFIELFKEL